MITLTNNIRKTVTQLDKAKYRKESGLFMAEGTKCVLDTIESFRLRWLFATDRWAAEHAATAKRHSEALCIVPHKDLERMSHLTTPPEVMAVYEIPERHADIDSLVPNLYLALDGVQDPGNLGTIMRTADWMGITTIFCSPGSADLYAPKVVQSTMGAISRVEVIYHPLEDIVTRFPYPVYGTFLDGEDIYRSQLREAALIVMGNEGRGISPELDRLITHRLRIPSYPPEATTSESLNVAVATAICVAEFRRLQNYK
ncbi:MAG: RNA methyltransferase [Bacteroides sp.]|nr:RNA methyltransferase [Bacteroides sp.]